MIAKIVVLVMVLATAGLASAPSASAACDWTNPQSFVDSVLILDNNFVLHDPGSAAYQPPTGQALNLNPQSPIAQDLFNAFEKASPSFRQKLCGSSGVQGLSAIFVNARGCGQNDPTQCRHTVGGPNFNRAWGFRSHPDPITGRTPPDSGDTYISISAADLWQNGSYARPLHNYETEILKSFQGWNGALALPATPDDSWMSVLAALAHEVGHVRWAEVTIPQPGDDYDLSLLTMCPQGDFFAGWNYSDDDDLVPEGRWRPFLGRLNGHGRETQHRNPPSLTALSRPSTANDALSDLLQRKQPWASLFAAQTPDEDFVETYVMAVLTGYDPIKQTFTGPLTSMPISIPGLGSPNVVYNVVNSQKPNLQNKIACVPL